MSQAIHVKKCQPQDRYLCKFYVYILKYKYSNLDNLNPIGNIFKNYKKLIEFSLLNVSRKDLLLHLLPQIYLY